MYCFCKGAGYLGYRALLLHLPQRAPLAEDEGEYLAQKKGGLGESEAFQEEVLVPLLYHVDYLLRHPPQLVSRQVALLLSAHLQSS